MKRVWAAILLISIAAGGCSTIGAGGERLPAGAEAISLLGEPLEPMPLDDGVRSEREAQLAEARARYEAQPTDEMAIIWLGRRLAYLGRYREAIAVFTEGLEQHPKSYRLLRHRGHRFITTRQLKRAVSDLQRASELIAGVPDAVEPDGMPNDLNQPRSTTHTNIWYHLGLVHYLLGDFTAAERAYDKCLELSANDDMRVASMYWLYLARMRLEMGDEAEAVLAAVHEDMEIIENHAYQDLLLLFKGDRAPEDLAPAPDDDGVGDATLAYGVAMWHLLQGDKARSREMFKRIIASPAWPAFGHIAAEAELARGAAR